MGGTTDQGARELVSVFLLFFLLLVLVLYFIRKISFAVAMNPMHGYCAFRIHNAPFITFLISLLSPFVNVNVYSLF